MRAPFKVAVGVICLLIVAVALWGDRLNVAAQCREQRVRTDIRCGVVLDHYPDPDRWCRVEYRVFPGAHVQAGGKPKCGTYSGDGDPLPGRADRG